MDKTAAWILAEIREKVLLLEIKGLAVHNQDQMYVKHNSARKWVTAVNNLKDFGKRDFMGCRDLTVLLPKIAMFLGADPSTYAGDQSGRSSKWPCAF